MKRILYIVTAVAVLAGLVCCSSEPRKVNVHEPGVYKGEKDPLIAQQKQQELIDRFRLVQTDR